MVKIGFLAAVAASLWGAGSAQAQTPTETEALSAYTATTAVDRHSDENVVEQSVMGLKVPNGFRAPLVAPAGEVR